MLLSVPKITAPHLHNRPLKTRPTRTLENLPNLFCTNSKVPFRVRVESTPYWCSTCYLSWSRSDLNCGTMYVDDPNDPAIGLMDGQLSIPGALLRREVYVFTLGCFETTEKIFRFDPVIEQVSGNCCSALWLSRLHESFRSLHWSRSNFQKLMNELTHFFS